MSLTSFARTVDALLRSNHNTTLEAFIAVNRDHGYSNDEIAKRLARLTKGTVEVSRTTIANRAIDVEKVSA
jgi:hypothetical protein